jgi:hypothetical protein
MNKTPTYVADLEDWELPRAQALEDELFKQLISNARGQLLNRELLGEELYGVLFKRLREIAGVLVNETIEYWLKGLTDGNNGAYPELCLELPNLERDENVDALTVDYCVENHGGTRTRLNRVNLGMMLVQRVEQAHARGRVEGRRITVLVSEVRALAERLATMEGSISKSVAQAPYN